MNLINKKQEHTKEIHLRNLPLYIRVLLNKNVRILLFEKVISYTGTIDNLRRIIQKETNKKISNESVRSYKIGKHYIPLWFLNKIIELFFPDNYYFNLEKKIVAFRGPRGLAIYNPNFPWREDERIIRIVFKIIGDGHAGGDISKGRVPMYSNNCKELINQFISDLNFFGEVKIRKYKFKSKKCRVIEFPKVIGHILKHIYNINFLGHKARLTPKIFSLPRTLTIQGIKVFIDDEGSVKGSQINVYSANKKLLEDIIKLIKIKMNEFKSITNVRINSIKYNNEGKKFKCYYFAILANDLDNYDRVIGFYHPIKQRKLRHQLRCRKKLKNNLGNYKTKELILKSLIESPKNSYTLSEDVLVNHRTINKHINGYSDKNKNFRGLKEIGLVYSFKKNNEGVVWGITKKGKTYNFVLGSLIK